MRYGKSSDSGKSESFNNRLASSMNSSRINNKSTISSAHRAETTVGVPSKINVDNSKNLKKSFDTTVKFNLYNISLESFYSFCPIYE